MQLTLNINYFAHAGQKLLVAGSLKSLGSALWDNAAEMQPASNGNWTLEVELPEGVRQFTYRYGLLHADGTVEQELGADRIFALPESFVHKQLGVQDAWRDLRVNESLLTAPFCSVFFHPGKGKPTSAHTHCLTVRASCLPAHCQMCITGSDNALGLWSPASPLLMEADETGLWQASFTPQYPKNEIGYKYAFFDTEQKTVVACEQGENRTLQPSAAPVLRNDEFPQLPFEQLRMAGVAVPIFSLRSERGFGAGEFADIPLLVDWAVKAGLKMIQILPINDTTATHTWDDSYPYSAISVFALHPLYLNLSDFAPLFTEQQQESFWADKAALNLCTHVDYPGVMQRKWKYIALAFKAAGAKTLHDPDFQAYLERNRSWLPAYAAFCYLRQKFGTADFSQWGEYAKYNARTVAELTAPKSKCYREVALHYFVQYHLHLQLQAAAQYARAQGVILKGDIPIGISRNSCDAWVAPQLYNMDVQAGAPPDAFSTTGQNWGFPTYRWDEMSRDGYRWWQQRLQSMSDYFDAFRIDHILGFFRIWEIPLHSVQGLSGYFSPALPLSIAELYSRGVWFDHDRLCTPYITKEILIEKFGDDAREIGTTFFEPHTSGRLCFKAACNTQRKIAAIFATQNTYDEEVMLKLFSLCDEVVLIEDKNQPAHYHPRIAFHSARSYQHLDDQQKHALDVIYNDFFYHRHNDFWREQAMKKLPAVRFATGMLVCGEDLGMVPDSVPEVMHRLSILSLIVQRMPNDSRLEFADLRHTPYASVCSPGSHDTSGIRLWWKENSEATQRYFWHVLQQQGTPPQDCEPWLVEQIVVQHLQSPSMWAVFPLQDLLAMDANLCHPNPYEERINQPSDPKNHWKYRMHLSLESLLEQKQFNRSLKDKVTSSGRK